MEKLSYLFLLLICCFPPVLQAHLEDGGIEETVNSYRCPPCGCSNDKIYFNQQGFCPSCEMKLIPVNTGLANQLDEVIAPAFNNKKFSTFYAKALYPIFIVAIVCAVFFLIKAFLQKSISIFLPGIALVLSVYGFKHQLYGVNYGLTANYKCVFAPISFILLLGPLVFWYIKSVTAPNFTWQKKDGLHLIPAILIFLFYTIVLLLPARYHQIIMSSPFEASISIPEQIVTIVGGLVYLFFAFRSYQDWQEEIGEQQLEKRFWLRRFIFGMGVLFIFWGVLIVMNYNLYDFGVATLTNYPLWILICLLLVWIGIEVTINPKVLDGSVIMNAGQSRLMIDQEKGRGLKNKLVVLMQEQNLYKDPNLTLEKLADKLDVNPRYLSGLLNQFIGKSFYEFINYYRVEEVKQLLKDQNNQHLTIEAIAREAGFKSKSTFNTAFKKQTKLTPREFMKRSG